jgi:hypothetical protein
MTFEEATREAALAAGDAVNQAMRKYRQGRVVDEDDLTGVLVGQLDAALEGTIGGLTWDTSILRHRRGQAAEEKEYGADLLIHVAFDTSTEKFSKGVLVQSKKVEPNERMGNSEQRELKDQCKRMLAVMPSAFIFDYAKGSMRCGSAIRIGGSSRRDLYKVCGWTPYRFFLELFRCPIGDHRIKSALVQDLPARWGLAITAQGELSDEITGPLRLF